MHPLLADGGGLVFWQTLVSVFGGGCVAAYLAHRFTGQRDRQKRDDDAREKRLERTFELRASEYLAAIVTIQRFQLALSRLAQTASSKDSLFPSDELLDATARMHLVASAKVQEASDACAVFWAEITVELDRERQKIAGLVHQILNLSQADDSWIALQARIAAAEEEFRKSCFNAFLKLQAKTVPLIVEMRRDLDLNIDRDEYAALVEKRSKQMWSLVDRQTK